jgi:hypothetical protein
VALPADLDAQVRALLARQPELPWDQAVGEIVRRHMAKRKGRS